MCNNRVMKLSVLVPIYNVEKYLPECLDSLCAVSTHAICTKCLENSNFCRLLFYLCLFVLFKNFGCKNLKYTIFEPLKLLFSLL